MAKRKPFYRDVSLQVLAGMLLGVLIGWLWPGSADWMRTLGDLFIRLISMVVGVIIFCAIVHGIATVREAKKVGRVAVKALIYFEVGPGREGRRGRGRLGERGAGLDVAATATVPVAAVSLILGVHRLMSPVFVAVNILGNALATTVISGWEGAVDRDLLRKGLSAGPRLAQPA